MEKSKKTLIAVTGIAVTAIVAILLLIGDNKKAISVTKVNPAFAEYISAYTSGIISSESVIRIRLASDYPKTGELHTAVETELFEFEPSIKGTTVWTDARIIEFRPSEPLPHKTTYTAKFLLSKLMEVPAELGTFEFGFQTTEQSLEVYVDGLKTYEKKVLEWQRLLGSVVTADVADASHFEKILTASQNGKSLKVRWEHDNDRKTHRFQVDSIARRKDESKVLLQWDGNRIEADVTGSREVEVPALGDFKLVDAKVIQSPDQFVSLQFSDPLDEKQDLNGLIRIGDLPNLKFTIEENEVHIYPQFRQSGSQTVSAEAGIKNILGFGMKNRATAEVTFEELKPAVRLVGNGVIIPSSSGIIFPFEAVSLKAVDVKVVKIYEDNIAQFLQVNNLDDEYELKRVGNVALRKTISLASQGAVDLGRWNRFSLDLSELIKTEPGAIYKVVLSFRRQHSLYHCDGTPDHDAEMEEIEESWDSQDAPKENSAWDYAEDYYGEGEDYTWSERDNPCHASYYSSRRTAGRNVLASDLGLIAKKGLDGTIVFAVTDILSTDPVPGAQLQIYDFQQQVIAFVETNGEGLAKIELKKNPFLLVAKRGNQRGYLKLDDGSSLSLSMFDVSGEKVQKGIKGFIYGERGVWRPGDSLYLTFMLEDKQHLIPQNYPVTMELYNPTGQLVKRMIKSSAVNFFYNFSTDTDENAPTGNWNMKVKVGGAVFTKTVKIETIMPNRLKIALNFGREQLSAASKEVSGQLNVRWLHGATARNLKALVEVSMSEAATTFSRFADYIFDDPTRKFYAEPQTIFEGNTDASGNATVSADLDAGNSAPGLLKANFNARVFEDGGQFSVDRFSIPFHPYDTYVGIQLPKGDKARGMLLTDTNHIVKIATVDVNGKPVFKNDIQVSLYKINWRWWWEKTEDDLSNYAGNNYTSALSSGIISTVDGRGEWKLRVNYPDWGRYLVRACDGEGHCTGKVIYMDWPGWAGRGQRDNPSGASFLSFSADKEKYKVGEEVKLTIPSSDQGRALISIESGSRIINTYWAQATKGQTVFTFPVTDEMTPNVYIHVTLVQPHAQTKNDLPIRLYGVIPIKVEDPNTHLNPLLAMPAILRPEEKVTISVKEQNGKAMTYTVAMVDEGLLDLTRFQTPDPWNSFYAREALGVKTWDMYNYVAGAYGGELERLFNIGGDIDVKKKAGSKTNRFKPMVRFIGPFYLEKGASASHTILIPQYIGSVRTMVIAGQDGAYGSVEKTTPVRKPLMVLATLPRVLGPGESVRLPVSVFAMEKNIQNVSVEITTDRMFTVDGEPQKTIAFSQPGDEMVEFNLKVKSAIGNGKVKVIARSGKETAAYTINISVRNPNPRVTDVLEAAIEPGQSWSSAYTPPGMTGTNKGMLEVSTMPPINLEQRLRFLITYPHGCIEQTTSSAFPQLYLADIMQLTHEQKARIDHHMKAAIQRLKSFQRASGGMGYWEGATEATDWGTNYAGHFMIEAEQKGHTLPQGFLDQWKRYQKQKAVSWSKGFTENNSDLEQAYRLYTLALAGAPELGAMNRMRETQNISASAKWRLAAAYQLAGQAEAARQITEGLSTTVKEYTELSNTFGTDDRDRAMILETLTLIGDRSKAGPLMKEICTSLSKEKWMGTHETAYCLMAVSKYAGKSSSDGGVNYSYKINSSNPYDVSTQKPLSQSDMKLKGASSGTIEVKNTGSSMVYVRVMLEGVPETGDQTAAENNLKMEITYRTKSGKELDPTRIEQGSDFFAEVSITNPGTRGTYKEMALSQIFPSGWEILNARMDNPDDNGSGNSNNNESGDEGEEESQLPKYKFKQTSDFKYQDIRDDRVYTYFDIRPNETKIFRIRLNAAYRGRYYLPTVYCEAMYDAAISARKPGKWVEVVTEGNTVQ